MKTGPFDHRKEGQSPSGLWAAWAGTFFGCPRCPQPITSRPAVLILGKAKKDQEVDESPSTRLVMPIGQLVWKVAFLSVIVYPVLFWTFGYYVAFSNPELVAFYGATHPGSFIAQMSNVWANDPFVFVFEIFRGALWIALAAPVIRTTKGRIWEAGLIVVLLFTLVQNDVHLLPCDASLGAAVTLCRDGVIQPDLCRDLDLADAPGTRFATRPVPLSARRASQIAG